MTNLTVSKILDKLIWDFTGDVLHQRVTRGAGVFPNTDQAERQINELIREARKETVLHFRKIAQYEKDRGYGCGRIIGETNIMAKNGWLKETKVK